MLASLALLAMVPVDPLDRAEIGDLYDAIWGDLESNARIDNHNRLARLWYNAGAEHPETPDLHIRDLSCRARSRGLHCTFILFRDGGIGVAYGEPAPDRLSCHADFDRQIDVEGHRFTVRHLLPGAEGGHSRTTMECRRAAAG